MSFKSETLCLLFIYSLFGLCSARSGLYSEESPSSVRIEQCHDGCIKKVSVTDFLIQLNVLLFFLAKVNIVLRN